MVVSSFAQDVTLNFLDGAEAAKTLGLAGMSDSNGSTDGDIADSKSVTISDVTFTISTNEASTPCRLWKQSKGDGQLRTYNGSSLTISSEKNIKSIVFTASKFPATADNGTFDASTKTWTGSSNKITFSFTGTSNINTIVVSLGEGEEGGEPEQPEEPEAPATVSVAEAMAAAANTNVCVNAQAVAITTQGAVLADATDFIYYYGTPNFKVGDAVTVVGPVSVYNNFNQFSAKNEGTTVTVGENTAVTYPAAVVMDGAAVDAWIAAPVRQYVTISGKLTISNNKYYNIAVDGASTGVGSLVNPTAELLEGVADGNNITVTGYAVYASSGKYMNIAATEIKVNEDSEGGTEEPDEPVVGNGVTFDFTNGAEEWGLPVDNAEGVTEGTYSNGTYSISVASTGTAKCYWFKQNKALLVGKQGATITLPAFDFAVGKIVTKGVSGGSAKTSFNIMVNGEAVSTEVTSCKEDHTFEIAESAQAAGTIYTLTVTNANNFQVSAIEIYEVGSEPETPDTPEIEGEVTVKEALAAAEGSNVTVKAQAVAVGTKGAIVADATGFIYYYGTPEFKVGDAVTIAGPVTLYGGFNQFNGTTATVTVGSNSAVTYPTPVEMDGAALDAWIAAPVQQYVSIRGTLSINGNYYNLNVEGAGTGVASLASPATELMEGVSNSSDITVTGYAAYVSGGKYMNIIVTGIKVNTTVELEDPSNTPETAYTVEQAIELIGKSDVYDLSKKVYTKGVIVGTPSVSTQYGNADYNIQTTGGTSTLKVYRGYFLENAKFTAEDQIKEGDEVIIYGQLGMYGDTMEILQSNYIYSLNGNITDGINSVQSDIANSKAYDLTGRVANKNAKGIVIINGKKYVK